jgi:toxin YoeB
LSKKKIKPQSEDSQEQPAQRTPVFDREFRENLGWWYKNDRHKADKILDLVTDTMSHPCEGLGKPEPLEYLEANTWSRRIDLEHRLVYRIRHDRVDFLSCRYHY